MAFSNVASITNAEFWDMARRFSPTFASHTAEATKVNFDEKGFEQISLSGTNVLNEFFEISMRVSLQMLTTSRARNPLSDTGLVQVYDTPNGGYVQRMAVNSIKPVSPAYKGLKDGDSVDPFVVRKPSIEERFFEMNFDYQSFITVQDYQMKTMFTSEYGMGELLAGILQGLANGYTIQEYENTKECMNAALNSVTNPLRDSQKFNVGEFSDQPTSAQLTGFILRLKDIATSMKTTPQSGEYNAVGFESVVDPSDMVLVMRSGIKSAIEVGLMVGAFNPDYLTLPFEVVEVDDFGGLIPHYTNASAGADYDCQEVYDSLGTMVGYVNNDYAYVGTATKQQNGNYTVEVGASSASTTAISVISPKAAGISQVDPNADVLAMVMQKGAIFETAQNPYTVEPIHNPRGMYNNYWANRPNTGIHYDALYNVIAVTKTSTASSAVAPNVGS